MELYELLVTAGLVVLIWIIQLLHYPSFRFMDRERFSDFSRFHSQRISLIVIPLMLSELGMGLFSKDFVSITIIGLIWSSTFLLQVPCHQKLQYSFDEKAMEKLIQTNWIRTVLWSIKFVYLVIRFF